MTPEELFSFYSQAYKLKLTLRHCWIGDEKRRESVADHSWALMMLAIIIVPQLKVKVDILKLLKMLAFHDLGEAMVGDVPATIKEKMDKDILRETERKGLAKIIEKLASGLQTEIMSLWEEFEEAKTNEALLANAIDKAEAIIQHDFSEIDTWEEKEYQLNVNYKDHYFDFDPYMRKLKDFINNYNYWLVDRAGSLDKLTQEQQEYWEKNKKKFKFTYFPF